MTISRHSASLSTPTPVAGPVTLPPPGPSPRERAHLQAEQQAAQQAEQVDRAALREERLAEMVAGLTGCAPAGALEAVRANAGKDDPLETVARAMIAVEDPDHRFRVTGYLRPRPEGRRPGGGPAAAPSSEAPRPHPSVVAPVPEAEVTMTTSGQDGPTSRPNDWSEDVVVDLRHGRPAVRIDLTMLDRMARVRREHREHRRP